MTARREVSREGGCITRSQRGGLTEVLLREVSRSYSVTQRCYSLGDSAEGGFTEEVWEPGG